MKFLMSLIVMIIPTMLFAFNSDECRAYYRKRMAFGNGFVPMTTSSQYISSTGACSMIGEVNHDSKVYIANNYEELRKDFARGSGEYAFALAALYDCSETARIEFPIQMKKRFMEFSIPNVEKMHDVMIEEIGKSERMKNECKLVNG